GGRPHTPARAEPPDAGGPPRRHGRARRRAGAAVGRGDSRAVTRPRLSVVVVTLDEEDRLRACLESVAWADELIVVDAESQDKTAQIARDFTDRLIVRPWPGFRAPTDFAAAEAGGDWILSLHADEQVSPELPEEIARLLAANG